MANETEDVELSEELLKQLGQNEAAGELVRDGNRKKKGESTPKKAKFDEGNIPATRPHNSVPSRKRANRGAEEFLEQRKLNKKQRQAMEKIENERKRKERRKELLASLSGNQLSSQEMDLMKSSSSLGKQSTHREVLKKEVLLERAGLAAMEAQIQREQAQAAAGRKKKKNKKKSNALPNKVESKVFVPEESESESDEESEADEEMEEEQTTKSENEALPKPVLSLKEKAPYVLPVPVKSKSVVAEMIQNLSAVDDSKSKFVVRLERNTATDASRRELPVCMMEQEIMEIVQANLVTVLCGETGSGKTTQVPQFLFEAGYGLKDSPDPACRGVVGVTQPRRVATVSMAERVANELGSDKKNVDYYGTVGYQIRHDHRTVNENTRVKFMTDGVLLREARDDLLLRKYSVIILDEAHERNLNTDILLGLLSRVVPLREQIHKEGTMPDVFPLRVIIMSATLRVDDFAKNPRLFVEHPPPVVNVESRQFPVTSHFSRRTELRNYLEETFKKVCAIHKRLPSGGILVFLTGQREIEWLVDALKNKFKGNSTSKAARPSRQTIAIEDAKKQPNTKNKDGESTSKTGEEVEEDETDYSDIDSDEDEEIRPSDSDEEEGNKKDEGEDEDPDKTLPVGAVKRIKDANSKVNRSHDDSVGPVVVLPLYSRLATHQQMAVFKEVPAGHRLIVVATNVAETSITIPGIKYVVDCGREKRKVHDQVQGTSKFEIGWVSQASANQRMGRAGRVGPGHCYRLYSSAVFNDHFQLFPLPEIAQLPIEDVVLYMKTMGIENIESFPFPSPPDMHAVRVAESRLLQLGALRSEVRRTYLSAPTEHTVITPLGRRITHFPVRARFGKMLALSSCDLDQESQRLAYVVAITAGLSLQEPFMHMQVLEEGKGNSATNAGAESSKSDNKEGSESAEKKPSGDDEEEKRKLREHAQEVNEMWKDETSDTLSLLVAAGAYAHVVATKSQRQADNFCHKHFLHSKTMKEQLQLRQQLARIAASMRIQTLESKEKEFDPDSDSETDELENQGEAGNDEEEIAQGPGQNRELWKLAQRIRGPLPPLVSNDKVYLRQIIASGFLDQVARKMTREEARAISLEFDFKLAKRWPYISCSPNVEAPLFLHPHSNLFKKQHSTLPEFVVYGHIDVVEKIKVISKSGEKKKPEVKQRKDPSRSTSLQDDGDDDIDMDAAEEDEEEEEVERTEVHYMRQVTGIQASWLYDLSKGTSQCSLSPILEQPPPTYNSAKDELLACVYPQFGPKLWKLPTQWVPFPAESAEGIRERASWFARSLFEGKVIPIFQEFKAWWGIPPAYMTRKQIDPKVSRMVDALVRGPQKRQSKKHKNQSGVFDRRHLLEAWAKDPSFLLRETKDCMQKEFREQLVAKWPSVVRS